MRNMTLESDLINFGWLRSKKRLVARTTTRHFRRPLGGDAVDLAACSADDLAGFAHAFSLIDGEGSHSAQQNYRAHTYFSQTPAGSFDRRQDC
jgi:hypothetical protein